MAGRGLAILQLVNGNQVREQNWQSTLPRGSNATQETRARQIGAVNANASHMPPSPMFAALTGVIETRSLVDQTMNMSGNADDVHAPRTIFKPRATVGYNGSVRYPFGEGTSKSRPPLPLPKWMTTTTETSPRREDIHVAMKKGKFVESSLSTSLATTTTKAVKMESQRLAPWVNVGSRSNYTGRLSGKLPWAYVERPKPKSNLTINLDDGPVADRDTNAKRLKLGKLDDVNDCPSARGWSKRWLFNGGKVVKKPEVMAPPNAEGQRRPSIAAMAMMGRAFLNGYEKPCEVQKRGAVTFWKL